MYLERLTLTDFRSYAEADFAPAPAGITVVTGSNGAGKTNLIEAVGYLATLRSLRGAPPAAMVRTDAPAGMAVVRATVRHPEPGGGAGQAPDRGPAGGTRRPPGEDRSGAPAISAGPGRRIDIAAELHAAGRDRVQVNGQPLRRTRDLLGALQVTVFSPDDLALVKGSPGGRRDYLDDLMVALQPRRDELLTELERVLKQRNALLKSAFSAGWRPGRPLPDDIRITLEVWDSKLTAVGERLVAARVALAGELAPFVAAAYRSLAVGSAPELRLTVDLEYQVSWPGPLADALAAARDDDLRRGVTTVGPQRDDVLLRIGGLAARTHASQGEQRTLALALRLAGHRLLTEVLGSPPVLLLDDVFSELDADRAEALMGNLPAFSDTQAIVTTAGALPPGAAEPAARLRVEDGKLTP